MALTYAQYTSDGSQTNFDVPCDYLSRAHISVTVDAQAVSFTWLDTYRIKLDSAPAAGTIVEVRRTTPRDAVAVKYSDGSVLVSADLNASTSHNFFLAQEAIDTGTSSLNLDQLGHLSARGLRITNVANPVNAGDAASKGWVESNTAELKADLEAARDIAVDASEAAETSSTQASAALEQAEQAKDDAEAARDAALQATPNQFVTTRAALKAINTTATTRAYLTEEGREGQFLWRSGNYSSRVAADPLEGIYIASNGNASGSTGVWVRQGGWIVTGLDVRWFGALGTSTYRNPQSNDTAAFTACRDLMAVLGVSGFIPSLPPGRMFRLTSTISHASFVARWIGSGALVTVGQTENTPDGGSWVWLDHAGIGFQFRDGAAPSTSRKVGAMKSFGIVRNQPVPGPGWVPDANAEDVRCEFNLDHDDMLHLNPTTAVYIRSAGVMQSRRFRGQPLSVGFNCERSSDVQRWDGPHFWPYWTEEANVKAYMMANAIAMKAQRADGLMVDTPFSIFYKRLFYAEDAVGIGSGLSNFHLDQPYADVGGGGIEIVSNYYPAYGRIDGYLCNSNVDGAPSEGSGFRLRGAVASQIDLEIRSNRSPEEAIYVSGAAHKVNVRAGRFNGWSFVTASRYMVKATDGAIIEFMNEPERTTGNGLYFNSDSSSRIIFPLKFTLARAAMSSQGFYSQRVTIADDGVAVFAAPGADRTCNLHLTPLSSPSNGNPAGSFWGRATGTPACTAISLTHSANVATGNTVLTGTSGVDGNLTISYSSDGNIYVENRTGASRSYYITLLGG